MELILSAVLVLGAIALVAALVLFGVSKKFAVEEDPRLGQVGELLPGANCGGCGFAGCSGMAAALVKGADAGSIDGLMCPVGGADVMGKVADLLGLAVANTEAKVAVVRCNGSCEHRPRIAEYDGLHTCAAMNSCGAGETGCGFGCLGCGDCVAACQFGAISINPETGLPEVDEEKCTGCGACAKACPRHIIELRKKGPKGRRVYVQCVNHDKGAVANTEAKVAVVRCNGSCEHRPRIAEYDGLHTCAAMNSCGAGETGCGFGCLGCGDCVAACQFGAISINPETGLPEVDEEKCTGCGACAKACPRHIIELRKKGPKGRRVYVQCVNHDKGAVAKKACSVACIGCGKCQKVCKFDAITIENNVAYVDFNKCRMCTKCVDECPTGALVKVNFPVKKKEE